MYKYRVKEKFTGGEHWHIFSLLRIDDSVEILYNFMISARMITLSGMNVHLQQHCWRKRETMIKTAANLSKAADCLWQDSYKEAQMPDPEELLSHADHLLENTDSQFRRRKLIWKKSIRGPEMILRSRGIKTQQWQKEPENGRFLTGSGGSLHAFLDSFAREACISITTKPRC